MNINLMNFGVTHFDKAIEDLPMANIDGITMGSKENLEKIIEVLNWCDAKNMLYICLVGR